MNPTMAPEPRPYLLVNKIQRYPWGTRGKEAFIPRLLGVEAEAERPYAELWIGTHAKASSDVVLDGSVVSLHQLILQYPLEILGKAVSETFSGTLPFLFKVLSAAEALSVQVHPTKEQAKTLHTRDPEHYPDENHKPELAVALDSLTALVGFKRFADALKTLREYPELASFAGEDVCHKLKRARSPSDHAGLTRLLLTTLVRRSITHEEALLQTIEQIERRLRASAGSLKEEEQVFLDLQSRYPGADVGLLSIFLLNLVHLEAGQGLFIGAGIPHAYLKGNIVECMANSDNVVRLGLTPKFKDAQTLIEILDYEPRPISFLGGVLDSGEVVYRTPAKEFQVTWWRLGRGQEQVETTKGPRVLLVTEGQVSIGWQAGAASREQVFRRGQSALIPAFLKEFWIRGQGLAELFKVEVPI